jgi:hypothetical protein
MLALPGSMRALGYLLDTSHKDEILTFYGGSLLSPLGSFLVVASAIGVLKGELLVVPYFFTHSIALYNLRSSSPGSQRLAACASLANTVYAIIVSFSEA